MHVIFSCSAYTFSKECYLVLRLEIDAGPDRSSRELASPRDDPILASQSNHVLHETPSLLTHPVLKDRDAYARQGPKKLLLNHNSKNPVTL